MHLLRGDHRSGDFGKPGVSSGASRSQWPDPEKVISEDCEAPRPLSGASRARRGERIASKGNIVLIVPLNPAYKAWLAEHLPAKTGDKEDNRS